MGDGNSEGPSTKTGEIVDGRPKCEKPSTKTGEIVDGRRKFRGVVHENGRNRGWVTEIQRGRPRKRAKSWMGGRNARGPSTKTGEIVDGRPECEGAVHENGRNRG